MEAGAGPVFTDHPQGVKGPSRLHGLGHCVCVAESYAFLVINSFFFFFSQSGLGSLPLKRLTDTVGMIMVIFILG